MNDFLVAIALFLLLTLLGGLQRIARGPDSADRMLSAQLFGTTGVAILLLLAEILDMPAVLDVALVAALLAAVGVVAFVHRTWGGEVDE